MKTVRFTDNPLNPFERICVAFSFIGILAMVFFLIVAMCGCRTSGVRVVASSRSIVAVGDINWDEYKIPVFSMYSGPALTLWVNKDFLYLKKAEASGSVTNSTSALGIYTGSEGKDASVSMEFEYVGTNTETRITSESN